MHGIYHGERYMEIQSVNSLHHIVSPAPAPAIALIYSAENRVSKLQPRMWNHL